MPRPTHLDLFAGIGTASLVAKALGYRTIGYVEKDDFCQRTIRAKIDAGIFPSAPIFNDVASFPDQLYRGRCDLLTAGPPCQPFSTAGKRLGEKDARDCMPALFDLVCRVRPRLFFMENTTTLLQSNFARYTRDLLATLAAAGYVFCWQTLGSDDCGGWHRRKRWWLLAADSSREPRVTERSAHSQQLQRLRLRGQEKGNGRVGVGKPNRAGDVAANRGGRERMEQPKHAHFAGDAGRTQGEGDRAYDRSALRSMEDLADRAKRGSIPFPCVFGISDAPARRLVKNRIGAIGNSWDAKVAIVAFCSLFENLSRTRK